MTFSKSILLSLFAILFFLPLPNTQASCSSVIVPIDKEKPAKVKRPKQKKLLSQYKRISKIKQEQKGNSFEGFFLISLLALLLTIVGAFMLALGLSTFLVWFIGLLLIGVSDLGLFLYILIADLISGGVFDQFFQSIGVALLIITMMLLNLVVGLIFIISGLAIANPILWIVGLVLLGLFLLTIVGIFSMD